MEQLSQIAVQAFIHALRANARLNALIDVLNLSDAQRAQYEQQFFKNFENEIEQKRPIIGDEAADVWLSNLRELSNQQ